MPLLLLSATNRTSPTSAIPAGSVKQRRTPTSVSHLWYDTANWWWSTTVHINNSDVIVACVSNIDCLPPRVVRYANWTLELDWCSTAFLVSEREKAIPAAFTISINRLPFSSDEFFHFSYACREICGLMGTVAHVFAISSFNPAKRCEKV